MTIAELRGKCKNLLDRVPRDVLTLGILLGASVLSFIFGYFAGLEARQGSAASLSASPAAAEEAVTGKFVASRSGTKYYLPTCSGASRISESNKIWFASVEEARAAGYSPASNCKGI